MVADSTCVTYEGSRNECWAFNVKFSKLVYGSKFHAKPLLLLHLTLCVMVSGQHHLSLGRKRTYVPWGYWFEPCGHEPLHDAVALVSGSGSCTLKLIVTFPFEGSWSFSLVISYSLPVNRAARFTGLADTVADKTTKVTNVAVFILMIDDVLRSLMAIPCCRPAQ